MQPDGRIHRVRRKSGIPLSTSREASPTRSGGGSGFATMERRLSGTRNRYYLSSSDRQTPLMAERILQQSQEAELAMEDALRNASHATTPSAKKRYTNDDHSDESETSR